MDNNARFLARTLLDGIGGALLLLGLGLINAHEGPYWEYTIPMVIVGLVLVAAGELTWQRTK